jgi:hypothetical protein
VGGVRVNETQTIALLRFGLQTASRAYGAGTAFCVFATLVLMRDRQSALFAAPRDVSSLNMCVVTWLQRHFYAARRVRLARAVRGELQRRGRHQRAAAAAVAERPRCAHPETPAPEPLCLTRPRRAAATRADAERSPALREQALELSGPQLDALIASLERALQVTSRALTPPRRHAAPRPRAPLPPQIARPPAGSAARQRRRRGSIAALAAAQRAQPPACAAAVGACAPPHLFPPLTPSLPTQAAERVCA